MADDTTVEKQIDPTANVVLAPDLAAAVVKEMPVAGKVTRAVAVDLNLAEEDE